MRDIVGQMLESRCVKEIFRPQKVLTRKSLRMVFERLAHASIMKLNSSAMDKVLAPDGMMYSGFSVRNFNRSSHLYIAEFIFLNVSLLLNTGEIV
jgi:hypothetical protein